MTVLTLEHVSRRFADEYQNITTAVDDVTLKIASGDSLAIIGPSGSGKSTLLRIAAGLVQPDSGRVLYDDQDLRKIPVQERRIGMVFQERALVPHWVARKSVGLFLSLRKREHELPERVRRISQITGIGLDRLLDRQPHQLSGGEGQQVSVARALARDARVLLFDEPFSNLDARLRSQARVELLRLLREFPVTTIFVTHDQIEATSLARRIAVMRGGRLEQIGLYEHLYHSPASLFVAEFIGTPTINLFGGYVRDDEQWWGVNFGGYPIRQDLPEGERIVLGVRAENVRLAAGGTMALVQQVTPMFAERIQLVEVSAQGETWVLQAALSEAINTGSTIHCELDPAGILYFDATSGVRVG